MAKTVKSYRLSDVAIAKVEALAKQRNVSASAVVEGFIMGPDIVADNDRKQIAPMTVRAKLADEPFTPASVAKQRLSVDPAKLAAFQEKTGMTRFGKKR